MDTPPASRADPAAWRVRLALLWVTAYALCGAAPACFGQPGVVSEQTVKAAFLYKFAEYVAWPNAEGLAPGSPFTIGVVGSGTIADDLIRLTADRTVNDRPVRVRLLTVDDVVEDVQMLFIGREQQDRLGMLLSPVRGRPILTVTESKGALADGSVINFTVNGDRVRFEISLAAAESQRLRLNSRLLAVAEHVYRAP